MRWPSCACLRPCRGRPGRRCSAGNSSARERLSAQIFGKAFADARAEYATKLNLALMELEGSLYWLELIEEAGIKDGPSIEALKREAGELSAIFVSLIKRAKG